MLCFSNRNRWFTILCPKVLWICYSCIQLYTAATFNKLMSYSHSDAWRFITFSHVLNFALCVREAGSKKELVQQQLQRASELWPHWHQIVRMDRFDSHFLKWSSLFSPYLATQRAPPFACPRIPLALCRSAASARSRRTSTSTICPFWDVMCARMPLLTTSHASHLRKKVLQSLNKKATGKLERMRGKLERKLNWAEPMRLSYLSCLVLWGSQDWQRGWW